MVFRLMEKIKQKEPDLGSRENRAAANALLPGALTAGRKTKEFDQTFGLKVGSNRLFRANPRSIHGGAPFARHV